MVRTRSSARGFLFDRLSQEHQYQLQELAQQSGFTDDNSSQSVHEDNSYEFSNGGSQDTSDDMRPTYRQGDDCKRHRVRDNQPYEVEVTSYRRRKSSR